MSADGPQTVWGFPATSWSLVRRARAGDERAAGEALDALCRAYWRPLYAYARGSGLARADAQDAVQEFFATALRRELFLRAEAERGKLRSFLLTAFKRVLVDRAAREMAARRNPEGGWAEVEFEVAEAEWARAAAAGGGAGPDAAFERQWARELLARALARTEARYAAEGKAEVFAELRAEALDEDVGAERRADSGEAERQNDRGQNDRRAEAGAVEAEGPAESRRSQGMSAGARRVAVFRLRKRFAEELRKVVADTLSEGADVEAELRELGAALGEGRT